MYVVEFKFLDKTVSMRNFYHCHCKAILMNTFQIQFYEVISTHTYKNRIDPGMDINPLTKKNAPGIVVRVAE